jgi:DNA ligase-associated metallophosphoesterase
MDGLEMVLHPQRALYFPKLNTLIISDLHLGKINHFRKAGIAVPVAANQANTETLIKLIMEFKPSRVIFIGDLFHSHYNAEWEVLGQVIRNFRSCSFELVPGNHDIMSATQYHKHNIELHPTEYALTAQMHLSHEPVEKPNQSTYYLSGHIHPAIRLTGKGKQSLTFPCFWFGEQQGYLPAFGVFTGFIPVRPASGDTVFAIVDDQVIKIESTPR